jgi:hypothetical protein
MSQPGNRQLAEEARRLFVDDILVGLPALVAVVSAYPAREVQASLNDKPGARQRREDAQYDMNRHGAAWHDALNQGFAQALRPGAMLTRLGPITSPDQGLSLVEDDTIEQEIMASRLDSAVQDRTQWEFSDLRARLCMLEGRDDFDAHDVLRASSLAKLVVNAWSAAQLTKATWNEVEPVMLKELSVLTHEAYHEANRYLIKHKVMPEIDLRPLVRRARATFHSTNGSGFDSRFDAPVNSRSGPASSMDADATRMMTRAQAVQGLADRAEVVMSRLNNLVARQVPSFAATRMDGPREVSPQLSEAISDMAGESLPQNSDGTLAARPALVEALAQRKAALKEAATSPVERATIEIVALMFQAILTEERLPASVRVWFARLQMPVLRVAVGEPDFFAEADHPARQLIDRLGACVMGFSPASATVGPALDTEIKRVVQVIEAYPDTGRRVFQAVLAEFEKFLENYFKSENEATKKSVSLAQQIEQRETLAIQYTIELRKMLNEVPVQDGIRTFLFQVWADVLALTAIKYGPQAEETKTMRLAAADLIWSAGAKVSREERAEVIRRLPPLLKTLRDGMASAGHPSEKQDQQIRLLNESLTAAFSARAAAIPAARFDAIKEGLETLEELLPDADVDDIDLDHTMMLDISGHDASSDMEVVRDGGTPPTQAMIDWAKALQVGGWYMLDYAGRHETVQLAWTGMRRHLSLFVSGDGRCVLFQQHRLAAFLQSGLLVPAQEETLTAKATRSAMEKIDADPDRLLAR